MRFIHKVSVKDFISSLIEYDCDNYMGIKISLETRPNNNYIGLFIKSKLPYGYDTVHFIFKVGILKNNSIVNFYKLEHTFTYDLEEQIGTNSFADKNKINSQKTKDDIYIVYEILECNYEENNSKMIQKIYQKVMAQDDDIIRTLKDKNHYTDKLKDELEKYNKLVIAKNEKTKIQYNLLISRFNELNRDLVLKDNRIDNLNETIASLKIEIDELKKEIKYYSPNTSITDYLHIAVKSNDEDIFGNQEINNIHNNCNNNQKYIVNIMDLDKVNIKNLSLYELKVMQGKLSRLNSIIHDKIFEQESCKICFSNELNCILLPCNHRCCCIDCSKNINNKCPVCRKDIVSIQKIY